MALRSVSTALVFAVLLHVAFAKGPLTSSDAGTGFRTNVSGCYDLSKLDFLGISLKTLCVDFRLESCEAELHAQMTYDGAPIFSLDFAGGVEDQCGAAQGPCQTCLRVDDVEITSTYARLCPKLMEVCDLGVGTVSREIPTILPECFELGSRCDGASCLDCMADSNCGWCHSNNKCHAIDNNNMPDCSVCPTDAQGASGWQTDIKTCPGYKASVISGDDDAAGKERNIALIAVASGIVAIAIGIIVCVVVRRRRSSSSLRATKMHAVASAQLDIEGQQQQHGLLSEQQDSEELGDYAQLQGDDAADNDLGSGVAVEPNA